MEILFYMDKVMNRQAPEAQQEKKLSSPTQLQIRGLRNPANVFLQATQTLDSNSHITSETTEVIGNSGAECLSTWWR
jgi:hypothetical protein